MPKNAIHEFRKAAIQLGMSRVQHSSTPNCGSLLPSSYADRSTVVDCWVGYTPNPKPRYWTKDAAGREGALANDVATGSSLVKFHHVKPFGSHHDPPSSSRISWESSKNTHGLLKVRFLKIRPINDVFFISGSLSGLVYTVALPCFQLLWRFERWRWQWRSLYTPRKQNGRNLKIPGKIHV